MAEPTVKDEELDTKLDATNSSEPAPQTETSEETKVWDEKYPKWQRMLPKEFWGDDRLASYQSLREVIESAVSPKKKAPESYDLKGLNNDLGSKLSTEFKKADLSAEEAVAITTLFKEGMPKVYSEEDLRETIGYGDYEVEKAYYENAIKALCGSNEQLKDRVAKSNFSKDPSFFVLMSKVGKNLGDGNFEDFKPDKSPAPKEDVWRTMVAKPKDIKR